MRNEDLAAENRILRAKIKGRLQLSEGEKRSLDEIAHRLGRKAGRSGSGWALANLGHRVSDQTVGNIFKRHGIAPAPQRMPTTRLRYYRPGQHEYWLGLLF